VNHVTPARSHPFARLAAGFATGVALLATLTVGSSVALAHSSSMNEPLNHGHGGVTQSHYFAYACDRDVLATISTQYKYWYGSWQGGVWVPGWRQSGLTGLSPTGCRETNKTPGPIGWYRVCRNAPYACTAWRAT